MYLHWTYLYTHSDDATCGQQVAGTPDRSAPHQTQPHLPPSPSTAAAPHTLPDGALGRHKNGLLLACMYIRTWMWDTLFLSPHNQIPPTCALSREACIAWRIGKDLVWSWTWTIPFSTTLTETKAEIQKNAKQPCCMHGYSQAVLQRVHWLMLWEWLGRMTLQPKLCKTDLHTLP